MSLPMLERIISEMEQHPHATLRIHAVGEPHLWSVLPEALRLCRLRGVRTWLFTSLVTRDDALLQAVAEYCDITEVSANSTSREDYRATKGIDAYDLVRANMGRLREMMAQRESPARLIVSRVESRDAIADRGFADHWRSTGIVDDAFVRSYHTYNDILPDRSGAVVRGQVPCLVHWSRLNVDCDGSVVVCFNELFKGPQPDPRLLLGNLGIQSIVDVWHGPLLARIRRLQLGSGDASPDDGGLPCVTCTSCQPLGGAGRPTSESQVRKLGR